MIYFEPSLIGRILLSWLVGAVSLKLMALLMPGVRIKSFGVAMSAAAILALVNWLFRGTLLFISFPITILTLGLFIIVIDALLLMFTAWLVKGFEISGIFVAIFAAIIYAFIHLMIEQLVFEKSLHHLSRSGTLKAWHGPRIEWSGDCQKCPESNHSWMHTCRAAKA